MHSDRFAWRRQGAVRIRVTVCRLPGSVVERLVPRLGLAFVAAAVVLDGCATRPYTLWLHVVAGLTIGGGLLWFFRGGELSRQASCSPAGADAKPSSDPALDFPP